MGESIAISFPDLKVPHAKKVRIRIKLAKIEKRRINCPPELTCIMTNEALGYIIIAIIYRTIINYVLSENSWDYFLILRN